MAKGEYSCTSKHNKYVVTVDVAAGAHPWGAVAFRPDTYERLFAPLLAGDQFCLRETRNPSGEERKEVKVPRIFFSLAFFSHYESQKVLA